MQTYSNRRPNAYGHIRLSGYNHSTYRNPYPYRVEVFNFYGKEFKTSTKFRDIYFNCDGSNLFAVASMGAYSPNKKWYIYARGKKGVIKVVPINTIKKDLAKIIIDLEEEQNNEQ